MYEQHGLMVKITNPAVLAYMRSKDESHTQIAETALCSKLGIPPKNYSPKKQGKSKSRDCRRAVPVKISDIGLIEHIITQKRTCGISYRHTVESAVLKEIEHGGK